MKYLIILLATILPLTVSAQKLIIGSEAPSLKDIQWLTAEPPKDKAMLIDFYQSTNPSCVKFRPVMDAYHASYASKIAMVILTREKNPHIDNLVAKYGNNYSIGYDPTGEAFSAFHVKYLPYSLIVNAKDRIEWIGNLGNLSEQTIQNLP